MLRTKAVKSRSCFEKNSTPDRWRVLATEVVKGRACRPCKEWKINGEAVTNGCREKRRIKGCSVKRFEKAAFKTAVKENVKTRIERRLMRLHLSSYFRQFLMQLRMLLLMTGSRRRSVTMRQMQRLFTICPWSS